MSLVLARPPEPPRELLPWVDYAKAVSPQGTSCPPNVACVQLSRLEVRGRADLGQAQLTLTGVNLGREATRVTLLQSAAVISVNAARWREGRGDLSLIGDAWAIAPQPGSFALELAISFTPQPSVPVEVELPVAVIADRLERGTLTFDESSERHGGLFFIANERSQKNMAQELSVRAARVVKFGSVATFSYRFTVTGLKEQARVELPRLGGETFEGLEPEIPYTVTDSALVVTLTPGRSVVTASGHYGELPSELKKPSALPFEYWLFESDPRHPTALETDGVEIDPGEVQGMDAGVRSRAYFVVENQYLKITPLAVELDKGRQGAGTAYLTYTQGRDNHWLGSLRLTSTTAPETDRIVIPTAAPPHYAESSGEAVRMFAENGVLSLRAVSANDQLAPISVQWRETVPVNDFASWVSLTLPGQSLHLDATDAEVRLLPGFVPMVVFGTEHASGHLVDGLHIYAVLIALLGMALGRAARFPKAALAVTGVLFVGLYTVEEFPWIALLLLLTGAAVVTQLPKSALIGLKSHRILYGLLGLAWLGILVATLSPGVIYIKERIFSALHPWSVAETMAFEGQQWSQNQGAPRGGFGGLVDAGDEAVQQKELEEPSERPAAKMDGSLSLRSAVGYNEAKKAVAKVPKATEKTVRPVPLEAPQLPAQRLSFGFGSLLPGTQVRAQVLLAGPILRGLWMFSECLGFGVVLALLVMRARRFWSVEVPS